MQKRRIAIISLIGLLLLVVGGIYGYGWWLERKLKRSKIELTARGEKLTVVALMADHRVPEQNSASLVNRASSMVYRNGVAATNPPSSMRLVAPGKAMIGWQVPLLIGYSGRATNTWAELEAELAKAQADITLLHDITEHPDLDFNLDYAVGFTLLLPHLAPLKGLTQSLSVAALNELHKNDAAAAAQHLRAMLALTKGMRDERLLISQLVRIAMMNITVNTTWELLQFPAVKDADLKLIQADFAGQDFIGPLERGFEMERAMGGMAIRHYRERGGIYDQFGSLSGAGPGAAPAATNIADLPNLLAAGAKKYFSPKEIRKNSNELLWQSALSFEDEMHSLQGMQVLIECLRAAQTNQPFCKVITNAFLGLQALGQLPKKEDENMPFNPVGGDDSLTALREMFGGTPRSLLTTLNKVEFIEVNRALVVTAIALQRYQLRHGNFPAALGALVPDFLSAAPRDPVDGQPLRYQLKSDGSFLLYSVGADGVDNGGDPTPVAPNYNSNPNLLRGQDWVWPAPATAEAVRAWQKQQLKSK